MRTIRLIALALAGVWSAATLAWSQPAGSQPASQPSRAQPTRAVPSSTIDIPDLVAKLLPSVVNISVIRYDAPAPPAPGAAPGTARAPGASTRYYGSGFVIDPSGLIVTNRHVIDNAAEITINFNDGTSLAATLVAAAVVDLALLRVVPKTPLAAVRWGDSFKLRQGTPVIAIGNPLGYSSTVTMGIISALDRDIATSPYDDYVQTDATVNPGNSGGPLFNLLGEVIGINSAIGATTESTGSIGIGFAIPSNDAQFVVNRLLQYDRVKPGWLPIKVHKPSHAVAEALNLPSSSGVIVTSVDDGRPDLAKVILPGDVILNVDGEEARDVRTFNRAVGVQIVGSVAPLAVWRDGRQIVVKVMIEDSPEDLRQSMVQPLAVRPTYVDAPDLGLNLSALNDEVRTRMKLPPNQPGVVVLGVDPFSKSAEQRILPGEVILRVQRDSIASVREFWSRVDQVRREGRNQMLLLIHNADGEHWVALPPG